MAAINQGLLSNLDPNVAAYDQEELHLTAESSFSDAMDLARMDTAFQAGSRILDQNKLEKETENEPKLSPEELNKKFPKMPKPFTEPMNLSVAKLIHGNNMVRQELQERVNAGPQDGPGGFLNKWGAGLLAHALDPLETAAGFVVGMALPVVAGGTAVGKALGIPSKLAIEAAKATGTAIPKATIGQSVARLTVEGTLQNTLNIPLDVYSSRLEQRDFNVEEALVGAVGAAAGFSVLHGAIKLGSNRLNRLLGRVSPAHTEMIQKTAIAQTLDGKKIEVEPILKEVISDTNYPKSDFIKIPNESLHEATFYSPKEMVTKDITHPSAAISDDYGNGIYFTDDQKVANGAAARKLNENDGSIIQGKIKDANLLDLDSPITDQFMLDSIKESGLKVKDGFTGKDYFNLVHDAIEEKKLPADFLETLKEKARANGIDGYRFTVNEMGGMPHAEHNGVFLFEKEKFVHESNLLPDQDAVPRISQDDVQTHFEKNQSIESSIHYEADNFKEYEAIKNSPPVELGVNEFKKQVDQLHEDLKSQIAQLAGTPEEASLLKLQERLKEDAKKSDLVGTLLKAAKDCLVG